MKEEQALEILREAHRAPVPEAHYAAVRARVMAQIASGRKPVVWRRWAACGLAAAALAAFAVWPKHHVSETRPVAKQTAMVEAPVRRAASEAVSQGHARRRRPIPVVTAIHRVIGPPNPQPLVVKMITDDPDVVIYWIAEPGGE